MINQIPVTTQSVGPVLFQYDLYPEKILQVGKVKKIITQQGEFALKVSNMSIEQANWFTHVIRRLERINYKQFVPVLPTKYGDFTVPFQGKTYYLQPWFHETTQIPEERKELILFLQLGKLHGLTEKQQDFSKESLEKSYQDLLKRWEKRKLELEHYAEEAERKTYMSPFELTFLTHFNRTIALVEEAKAYLKKWYDTCLENERFRAVLCHGKLDRSHIYYHPNGYGYLFNFEKAILDTPARDLAISFRKSFQYSMWDGTQGVNWLQSYESFFKLEEEEKSLFASYLCYPELIFRSVDHYRKRNGSISELQYVQILEKRIITMSRVNLFIRQTLMSQSNEPM